MITVFSDQQMRGCSLVKLDAEGGAKVFEQQYNPDLRTYWTGAFLRQNFSDRAACVYEGKLELLEVRRENNSLIKISEEVIENFSGFPRLAVSDDSQYVVLVAS